MRWLALTLALLAASAGLLAWVYLRDRDTSDWLAPERQRVHSDGWVVLTGEDCHRGCAVSVQGRVGPHLWLVRLAVRGSVQCVQIDPETFTVTARDGLVGVRGARGCGPVG